MKFKILGVAWLALGFFTNAWADSAMPDEVNSVVGYLSTPVKIVKIGSAEPKTGGIAHLGKDNELGALLAVKQINAKDDLIIGGEKIHLKLVGADDAGDPKMGPIVAQTLVDAGVVAVVGHLNSGVSIPANVIYSKAGMVQVSPSSTNPTYTFKSDRTPKGSVSAYRVQAHDGLQGEALANYVIAMHRFNKVAIMDDASQYGKMLGDDFEKNIERANVKVVAREAANDKTTDFKAALTKIKSTGAQMIFWGGMDDTAATLVKQMRELGMKTQLISGDGACTDLFIEQAGAAGEGMLCAQAGLPLSDMPHGKQFASDFEQAFPGYKVQIYAPFAYDAVYSIDEAMKIANSTEREAIAAAMPKVDFEGVTGRIRFDARGDIINGSITIFKVQDGKLTVEKVMR